MLYSMIFSPKPKGYKFNMRDNVALQFMQCLIKSGRHKEVTGTAILAVEAYDLADSFITQVIHEKRDGK